MGQLRMVFVMISINDEVPYIPTTEFDTMDKLGYEAYILGLEENIDFVVDKRLKAMV